MRLNGSGCYVHSTGCSEAGCCCLLSAVAACVDRMQLAVNAQLPPHCGGLSGKVIYIGGCQKVTGGRSSCCNFTDVFVGPAASVGFCKVLLSACGASACLLTFGCVQPE
jgi:hypothetical protein